VLAPLLHSSILGSCSKKRFQRCKGVYAVHPLENYSFHPIGSQSGYCYPTPEMPNRERAWRPALEANFSIRRCDISLLIHRTAGDADSRPYAQERGHPKLETNIGEHAA